MAIQRNRTRTIALAVVAMVALAGETTLAQMHHEATSTGFRPASDWSRPVQLNTEPAIGSPGGTHPLAIDGKTVYASWVQKGVVNLRVSPDGGASWGHPTPVTAGGTALYPCSLEIRDSVLHLFWPDSRNNGLWEPYYKRSTDGGKTWSKETRLSPGTDLFRRRRGDVGAGRPHDQ